MRLSKYEDKKIMPLTGKDRRRVMVRIGRSWTSILAEDNLRGGVRECKVIAFGSFSWSSLYSGGVGFCELLDGELSLHILSLSLSHSSPMIALWLPPRLRVE